MKSSSCAVAALILVPVLWAGRGPAGEAAGIPVMGKAATVNPYNGMQEREEKFEFAQKPQVKKDGDRWTITFATTAACDATVTILDKDGQVVRHLASGVLGKNAPYPFQQNSLSQKLEWDGLTTDFKKADTAGCTVRVSLGLKPEFERNILYDPNELIGFSMGNGKLDTGSDYLVSRGQDGTIYVIDANGSKTMDPNGRAFDKDGKYLRTFFPPAAKDVEALMTQQGWSFATTTWGDKVGVGGTYGILDGNRGDTRGKSVEDYAKDALAALKAQPGAGEAKVGPRPTEIPASSIPRVHPRKTFDFPMSLAIIDKYCRMTVDRKREELYAGYIKNVGILRFNGKTGQPDGTWFPNGELLNVVDCNFGPDGLLYLRFGPLGYGRWVMRVDHEGKPVPFPGGDALAFKPGNTWPDNKEMFGELAGQKAYGSNPLPGGLATKEDVSVLWTGETDHSNTHTRGLYVSPNGLIVAPILFQGQSTYTDYLHARGIPKEEAPWSHETFVALMDTGGKYHSANAVGATCNGHNAFMDRDGNIYTSVGGALGVKDKPDGIADGGTCGDWGEFAHMVKFQWTGKPPVAKFDYSAGKEGLLKREGALWAYPGIPGHGQHCTCHNNRADMDYWARIWVGANQLCSLVVLDSNGNRMGRFGRYGNVDDSDTDVKEKRDGLRFSWIRAVATSDTAVYVDDQPNRRILKAALKYAAEESVPLP